jgi:hypothetical protein
LEQPSAATKTDTVHSIRIALKRDIVCCKGSRVASVTTPPDSVLVWFLHKVALKWITMVTMVKLTAQHASLSATNSWSLTSEEAPAGMLVRVQHCHHKLWSPEVCITWSLCQGMRLCSLLSCTYPITGFLTVGKGTASPERWRRCLERVYGTEKLGQANML